MHCQCPSRCRCPGSDDLARMAEFGNVTHMRPRRRRPDSSCGLSWQPSRLGRPPGPSLPQRWARVRRPCADVTALLAPRKHVTSARPLRRSAEVSVRLADLLPARIFVPQFAEKPRSAIHDRYVMALARPIRARLASSPAPATYPPRGVPPKRKRPPERADASFQRSPETRGRRALRRK
jgi:hypothetical protein